MTTQTPAPHDLVSILIHKLNQALLPTLVHFTDESDQHRGHQDADKGAHLKLLIVSPMFASMHDIERHRLIYRALKEEMNCRIHALSINAFSPEEYQHESNKRS